MMSIPSWVYSANQLNHSIFKCKSVVELVVEQELSSGSLGQLAIAHPNLQRLDLKSPDTLCLTGLCTIAHHCHNFQGLSLLGHTVNEVENQARFWEILTDTKLTHLAVDACVLLSSLKDKKQFITFFQKCRNLRALELGSYCSECTTKLTDNGLFILSHFPSLIHCVFNNIVGSNYANLMRDILISCGQLKYLNYVELLGGMTRHLHNLDFDIDNCNLQQLHFHSQLSDLPSIFMSSISANGGLVHVVLCAKTVTSEGVIVLIENSLNLLTLHVAVYHGILGEKESLITPENFMAHLRQMFSNRKLFKLDCCILKSFEDVDTVNIQEKILYDTDLDGMWT